MSTDESLARAEKLLARLDSTRAELDRLSETDDAEKALDILGELVDLSRAVQEELERAKRQAEIEADAST